MGIINSIFNVENRVWSTITKAGALGFLSVCAIILCLPVITAVPALIALYYAVVKSVRHDRSYPYKEYFRAFSQNLRQGVLVSLASAAYLFIDWLWYCMSQSFPENSISARVSFIIALALAILFAMVCVWMIPVLSRFKVTFSEGLRISLFFSLRYLGETILMLVLLASAIEAVLLVYVSVVIVPGVYMLVVSFWVERVFVKYCSRSEEQDGTKDTWYLE